MFTQNKIKSLVISIVYKNYNFLSKKFTIVIKLNMQLK